MTRRSPVSRRPSTAPRSPGDRRPAPRHGAPITLVYLRPDSAEVTELDGRLAEIARRYAPIVALEIRRSTEAGPLARWSSPDSPAVLVLRRGVVIGEAMGDSLPVRELDQAVRRAVEWPATR